MQLLKYISLHLKTFLSFRFLKSKRTDLLILFTLIVLALSITALINFNQNSPETNNSISPTSKDEFESKIAEDIPAVSAPPTATPVPPTPTEDPFKDFKMSETPITMALMISGIGNVPGGNLIPSKKTRNSEIEVVDQEGKKSGTYYPIFDFKDDEGVFKTQFNLFLIKTGPYKFKIKLNNTLWKIIGPIEIIEEQEKIIDQIEIVSGDITEDNAIDLQDYNILISCYGEKACEKKEQADLNDDRKIDEQDINILYFSLKNKNKE